MYFITTKRMLEVCFSAHPNIQYRTCFFYEIGEVVSNIRAYVRQDKWERAMDKFVMTSAEDWQQDKNTTGCISVPLVPAIKVSNIIESSVSYAHTKQ